MLSSLWFNLSTERLISGPNPKLKQWSCLMPRTILNSLWYYFCFHFPSPCLDVHCGPYLLYFPSTFKQKFPGAAWNVSHIYSGFCENPFTSNNQWMVPGEHTFCITLDSVGMYFGKHNLGWNIQTYTVSWICKNNTYHFNKVITLGQLILIMWIVVISVNPSKKNCVTPHHCLNRLACTELSTELFNCIIE